MNGTAACGLTDLDMRIKEAETCHAMGMAEEGLKLYEQVITSGRGLSAPVRQALAEKVDRLRKEISDQQASESQGLSPEDISLFRKTLAAH